MHTSTTEELREDIAKIEEMPHLEMARLWRFAPMGHRYFDVIGPLWPVFEARWNKLGGMTPEISKQLGWDSVYQRRNDC